MTEKPLFELPKLLTLSGVDVQSVASVEGLLADSCKNGGGCRDGGGCNTGGAIETE